MNIRKYKVRADLLPFVETVLKRRQIEYKVIKENDVMFIESSLSNNKQHEVIIRAICEKKDYDEQGLIPDISSIHPSEDMDAIIKELGCQFAKVLR